jgi:hypothetical protein
MTSRRSLLRSSLLGGSLAGFGGLDFLSRLQPVSAQEAAPDPRGVRLHGEVEPLVRLLEDTPRERVLEEVAARLVRGLSYRELLAALLLAGVRNIQPRPVGFKFHAVLVVNSAHLASLASADTDRWLPLLLGRRPVQKLAGRRYQEGDWTMGPVDERAVPPPEKARAALIHALDRWDEPAADAAIVGLARSAGANEIFDLLCRYGARDFRDIGHKEIYVANSFRTLEVIGWHHAEPVLRSLVYALLDRGGATENPADADLPADRPFRANLERFAAIRPGWTNGTRDNDAATALLGALRSGSPDDASSTTIDLLARGASPASLFDAMFSASGELMMRDPGIVSLHAATFTNAVHYAWQRCGDDTTRRLLLLQNAAFLPLFRGTPKPPEPPSTPSNPSPPPRPDPKPSTKSSTTSAPAAKPPPAKPSPGSATRPTRALSPPKHDASSSSRAPTPTTTNSAPPSSKTTTPWPPPGATASSPPASFTSAVPAIPTTTWSPASAPPLGA